MLYDIIIRLLGAFGLSLIINANGITTTTVVVSICIFLIFEISTLVSNKVIYWGLTGVPAVITVFYVFLMGFPHIIIYTLAALILVAFTMLSSYLCDTMLFYKELLHRTRDDSKELESALKTQNRQLLSEQDQQVHLATLTERNRIAREIHDNVGHLLSRAILLLGAINTVNTDEKLAPQLNMLANTLDESMAKMRASVHDLHDDSIDLRKNFEDIMGELKDYSVSTELDFDEEYPTDVKLSLIGILKEAVTNILKHSNGDTISVILHRNYSFCTLSVTDNGTMTSEEKEAVAMGDSGGIGLNNIKNRAHALGGEAYFYTNDGFTVFARLPLKEE